MIPQDYSQMSDLDLLSLCLWREGRGEFKRAPLALRGIAHTIKNRVEDPGWWGHDWKSVILKPWQFSSFNANDVNSAKWPEDIDPSWSVCKDIASQVYSDGTDTDITNGATHYHDRSIGWPSAWGEQDDWLNTINIDAILFYKQKPTTHFTDTEV